MSKLMEQIMNGLDERQIQHLSDGLGADHKQTQGAVAAALPLLMGALQRNAADTRGAAELDGALRRDHDGSVLNSLGSFLNQGQSNEGQKILEHIFGQKQQNVEQGVAKLSGLNSRQIGQMLSVLAPVVMGALGKTQREENLNAADLRGLLQREQDQIHQQQPEASGLMGMILDADGDGDVDAGDLMDRGGAILGGLFKK